MTSVVETVFLIFLIVVGVLSFLLIFVGPLFYMFYEDWQEKKKGR